MCHEWVELFLLHSVRNDNLFVILYGCKPWSVTLSLDHRLMMFVNTVLRIMFGPKKDEVPRGRKFCIMRMYTLHTLHYL
jgi:hypothetical protein